MAEGSLAILTLNVASPSEARAKRQLEWLGQRAEQVFVLTEVSTGKGSALLAERLRAAGWEVRAPVPGEGERAVMVASRVALGAELAPVSTYIRERAETVAIGELELIGVYAPSRDQSAEKIARKRRFLAELLTVLGSREAATTVLIGDLNIVERSKRGTERVFEEWEYELYEELPTIGWLDAYRALHPDRVELSWSDGEGHGYRFDHTFITADLRERVRRCEYLHETREADLSDHSAMVIELERVQSDPLEVDQTLAAGPPSLF